jgi:peptide/nickel transport system ATP-binding protein
MLSSSIGEGLKKMVQNTPLVELRGISKRFIKPLDLAAKLGAHLGAEVREEIVHAVDNFNLSVYKGEVVGLAGESGCGKSTVGNMIVGIHSPSEGTISYRGQEITSLPLSERRKLATKIQMIFQDPFDSLNPRLRIREAIGEGPSVHRIASKSLLDEYIDELMERVGLAATYKSRYPHQFSGGQRQRICIARALAVKPEFLVCDEPISSLDVSIQAQILNLFMELRKDLDLTYLFISHDLGVIEHLSDRVVIMYLGRIVEVAPAGALFATPNHPYTQALLAQVPRIESRHRVFDTIKGEIPSPLHPPAGCHFHPRCPYVMDRCRGDVPALKEISPDRSSACHLNDLVSQSS